MRRRPHSRNPYDLVDPYDIDPYNQAVSDGSLGDERVNLLGSMPGDADANKSSALRLGFV